MTTEQMKKNDHIPIPEVQQDIIDTQKEINTYNYELDALRKNPQENRVAIYMREGRILKRQSFIDKLNEINDLINDMEDIAKIYHGQFLKDYIKFKMDFNFFVSTYEEIKRFKVETALEDFLDTLEILKKDLLE
ncbi:hypothetical protein LCGC14_2443820 [marine sediment metagenome]|uniref:Uncharacterized protein n=1 Tax=marine sediment metagenome TaxID=412755 RepID=A0A0F9DV83_9ZZZZ